MIARRARAEAPPGVALTVNVDGFGNRADKSLEVPRVHARPRRGRHNGFKLFYSEDTNLMPPRGVLSLRPAAGSRRLRVTGRAVRRTRR